MRFLILSQYFLPEIGAPQTRLSAMSKELIRLGHEVEVVTALPNYPRGSIFPEYRKTFYRHEHRSGVSIHRVWVYACVGRGPKRLLNYLSFTLTSMFGLLRSRRPDYVFVESPPLFLGVPGWIISRLHRATLIFNVADLWPDSVHEMGILRRGLLIRLAEALEHAIYRKANYVVAVTCGIRKKLVEEKHVPPSKVLFLPNGVDTDLFKPLAPDAAFKRELGLQDKKVVIYQGSEGYAHNLENVLQAAKLLARDRDIHFLFVGDGSARKDLEKLKQDLQLDNVTFLDTVPREELPRFFSIANCGLVSLREAMLFDGARPAKTLPIMSSGKPILYVGKGEGAKLVLEAKAGVVVPPGNPQALAASTRALLDDTARAADFGRNGRAYVQKHMKWSSLIEDWLVALTNAPIHTRAAA